MSLDDEQREFFDSLDDFTEQMFISTQYAGLILSRLRRWKAEGRPVGTDALTEWAKQREHPDRPAGILAGLALAVEHDDDPWRRVDGGRAQALAVPRDQQGRGLA